MTTTEAWLDQLDCTTIYWDPDYVDAPGRDTDALTAATIRYDAITTALQGRPGEWALVAQGEPKYGGGAGNTTAIGVALRRRGCQVSSRRLEDDDTISVWARWVDA